MMNRGLVYTAIKNAYVSLISVPIGVLVYRIKYYRPGWNCIIVCDHIGDAVISAGYIKEFKLARKEKKITVLASEKLGFIFNQYAEDIDSLVLVKEKQIHMLMGINRTNWGQQATRKYNATVITPTNNYTSREFDYIMRFHNQTFVNCIKEGIMDLPDKVTFRPYKSYEKMDDTKSNLVIIAPGSKTIALRDIQLFESIAVRLKDMGYDVYTNLDSDADDAIKGTEKLLCKLEEIPKHAAEACCVVGMRSGLMDLLCFSAKHIIAIYNDEKEQSFFGLKNLEETTAVIDELVLQNGVKENDIIKLIK